ncbi:single-stranded DNA-binding protein [Turicibacter sanguinis]|uniref:single-stranded DNA-binding protein n=1 Tax=Turicibacter sanguinis TaxID=154288 RepID=UPI0018AAB820|nr:single-stranded DNA-binding protein [Turicibacter sanguinis]MDB8552180.1 single-stranded DNA-binding protein [Turicibacter sanguinis]
MINQVVLIGRLTKDIELTYTRNNKAYTKFTLAVNRSFKDEKGSQQADFIRVVAWGKQAENTAKFVKKGALIGVTGRIETGSYDDNGTTRYTTDVVANSITFLESKNSQHQEAGFNQSVPPGNQYAPDFNPFDPNFSNPNAANYNSPFATATTMAGKIQNEPLININDDDLPY